MNTNKPNSCFFDPSIDPEFQQPLISRKYSKNIWTPTAHPNNLFAQRLLVQSDLKMSDSDSKFGVRSYVTPATWHAVVDVENDAGSQDLYGEIIENDNLLILKSKETREEVRTVQLPQDIYINELRIVHDSQNSQVHLKAPLKMANVRQNMLQVTKSVPVKVTSSSSSSSLNNFYGSRNTNINLNINRRLQLRDLPAISRQMNTHASLYRCPQVEGQDEFGCQGDHWVKEMKDKSGQPKKIPSTPSPDKKKLPLTNFIGMTRSQVGNVYQNVNKQMTQEQCKEFEAFNPRWVCDPHSSRLAVILSFNVLGFQAKDVRVRVDTKQQMLVVDANNSREMRCNMDSYFPVLLDCLHRELRFPEWVDSERIGFHVTNDGVLLVKVPTWFTCSSN